LWRTHSCVPSRHSCRDHGGVEKVSTRHGRVRAPYLVGRFV
jgi:hypothetical protein